MGLDLKLILSEVLRRYKFTLFFGAMILLVTIPYNLLLSPSQYCGVKPPWAAVYMHLTSPFNIGCESSLLDLWTPDGALRFVGNFTFVLIFAAMVEYALNPIGRRLKRNVFAAAIMGAYLLEIATVFMFKTMSVGTSIIGLSMMLTMIGWLLYKAWLLRKNPKVSWIPVASAIFFCWLAYTLYSAENSFGHTVGGLSFLFFMVLYLKQPNWWEEWLAGLGILKNRFFPRKSAPP